MSDEEVKEGILSLDSLISERMKKYIHYKSMKNFVLHIEEIKNPRHRSHIMQLLSQYLEETKENDYNYDVSTTGDLARKYLFVMGDYYRRDANFVQALKIEHVFLYGIMIDSLLYFAGILSKFAYLPLTTIGFLTYYLFVSIFKEKKGRVYGVFY